jgi:hypothetical protein
MSRAIDRRTVFKGALSFAAGYAAGSIPLGDAKAASAIQAEPDPIFAAIERVRSAWDDLDKACTETDHAQLTYGLDSVQYERADANQDVVSDQHWQALHAFLSTVPTTLPGVVAYVTLLEDNAVFGGCAIEPHQYELIAASLKAAVLRYVALPASTAPVAEAVPVTRELLENYDAWLLLEHRRLNRELGNNGTVRVNIPGSDYHWRDDSPSPSTRAARVLSAVGCPLAWEA